MIKICLAGGFSFLLGSAKLSGMESEKTFNPQAGRVIDKLGGTCAVARMCDIKPPSVTEWRTAGIPKPWLKYFMCVRPDLFEKSENNNGERE